MGGEERAREVKWVGVRERTDEKRADEETQMKGEVKMRAKNSEAPTGRRKRRAESRKWRGECRGRGGEELWSCSVSCHQTRASRGKREQNSK